MIELLVVVAISGVLLAMLLPAVQNVREASNRTHCANNLRQMGLAFQAYHHDFKSLPPGLIGYLQATTSSGSPIPNGIKNHTAFTLILPYIEQDAVYRKFQPDYASCNAQRCYYTFGGVSNPGPNNLAGGGVENCPGNANAEVVGTYIKTYACPSDREPAIDTVEDFPHTLTYFGTPFPMVVREMTCTNARRSNYLLSMTDTEDPGAWYWPNNTVEYWYGHPARGSAFGIDKSLAWQEFRDGLSTTFLAGETRQEHARSLNVPNNLFHYWSSPHWGTGHVGAVDGYVDRPLNSTLGEAGWEFDDYGCPVPANYPDRSKPWIKTFGSWHNRGANFLFADGAVRYVRNRISYPIYAAMGTPNGREPVPDLDVAAASHGTWE